MRETTPSRSEAEVDHTGLVLAVNWKKQNDVTDLLRCKHFRFSLNITLNRREASEKKRKKERKRGKQVQMVPNEQHTN